MVKITKRNLRLPIKLHEKLVNESLVILFFGMNKLATNSSKQVKILHKYDHRCLEIPLELKLDKEDCKN